MEDIYINGTETLQAQQSSVTTGLSIGSTYTGVVTI